MKCKVEIKIFVKTKDKTVQKKIKKPARNI